MTNDKIALRELLEKGSDTTELLPVWWTRTLS